MITYIGELASNQSIHDLLRNRPDLKKGVIYYVKDDVMKVMSNGVISELYPIRHAHNVWYQSEELVDRFNGYSIDSNMIHANLTNPISYIYIPIVKSIKNISADIVNTYQIEAVVNNVKLQVIVLELHYVGDVVIELTDVYDHQFNRNNPHNITKHMLGLGNVDNTSDVEKPVSNAIKAYIDELHTVMVKQYASRMTALDTKLNKLLSEYKRSIDDTLSKFESTVIDRFNSKLDIISKAESVIRDYDTIMRGHNTSLSDGRLEALKHVDDYIKKQDGYRETVRSEIASLRDDIKSIIDSIRTSNTDMANENKLVTKRISSIERHIKTMQ